MERQPVSERVTRNRGFEPPPAMKLAPSSGAWTLSWPAMPGMLKPLEQVWKEWKELAARGQWEAFAKALNLPHAKLFEWAKNKPSEDWLMLADQLMTVESSDPAELDRAVTLRHQFQPRQLLEIRDHMREHLQQWPRMEGLDPENVWALVCQPVQTLSLVLVQGSPEAIGQALAQHLVVGTTPEGQDVALRLPGTAVRLTPEQATAASWAANRNGLFLRLVDPTE